MNMHKFISDAIYQKLDDLLIDLNSEQKRALRKFKNISDNFRYYRDLDEGIVFEVYSSFNTFEYFSGLEYDKDKIEWIYQSKGYAIVCYSNDCQRALSIYDMLEELEDVEDDE